MRPATQGNLLHLLCDLRRDASRVKIGKAVRLVQLDGILPLCESRDCFDHGAVFDLRLVNAATVDDPYCVAVQKDFGCIDGTTLHAVGGEHSVRNPGGKRTRLGVPEVGGQLRLKHAAFRQLVRLVEHQTGTLGGSGDSIRDFRFTHGTVNREGRITDLAVVIDINGYADGVRVGSTNRFQLPVYKEQLVGVGLGRYDPESADFPILPKQFLNIHDLHPSFTLTFRFGPPSETRTHSL